MSCYCHVLYNKKMADPLLFLLLIIFCPNKLVLGVHHWIVKEAGRIEPKLDGGFPVRRPYDIVSVLTQEQRLQAVIEMQKKLEEFQKSVDLQWANMEKASDLESRIYNTDSDCLAAAKKLSSFDFDPVFEDYKDPNIKRPLLKEDDMFRMPPDCRTVHTLDFTMLTLPHLPTLADVSNITDRMDPIVIQEEYAPNVNLRKMFASNKTDWSTYNLALYYWSNYGNATNAIECARRAIYFVPRHLRHFALFNLGTLLQSLRRYSEAAIVLHMAVDSNPRHFNSHKGLGDVYVKLADYNRAAGFYKNAIAVKQHSVYKEVLMVHSAVLCHQKILAALYGLDAALKKVTEELQEFVNLEEQWIKLYAEIEIERASSSSYQTIFFDLHPSQTIDVRALWNTVKRQLDKVSDKISKANDGSRLGISSVDAVVTTSSKTQEKKKTCTKKEPKIKDPEKERLPDHSEEDDFDYNFHGKVSEVYSYIRHITSRTHLSHKVIKKRILDKISSQMSKKADFENEKEVTLWEGLKGCVEITQVPHLSDECCTPEGMEPPKPPSAHHYTESAQYTAQQPLLDESDIENYVYADVGEL